MCYQGHRCLWKTLPKRARSGSHRKTPTAGEKRQKAMSCASKPPHSKHPIGEPSRRRMMLWLECRRNKMMIRWGECSVWIWPLSWTGCCRHVVSSESRCEDVSATDARLNRKGWFCIDSVEHDHRHRINISIRKSYYISYQSWAYGSLILDKCK